MSTQSYSWLNKLVDGLGSHVVALFQWAASTRVCCVISFFLVEK